MNDLDKMEELLFDLYDVARMRTYHADERVAKLDMLEKIAKDIETLSEKIQGTVN